MELHEDKPDTYLHHILKSYCTLKVIYMALCSLGLMFTALKKRAVRPKFCMVIEETYIHALYIQSLGPSGPLYMRTGPNCNQTPDIGLKVIYLLKAKATKQWPYSLPRRPKAHSFFSLECAKENR